MIDYLIKTPVVFVLFALSVCFLLYQVKREMQIKE